MISRAFETARRIFGGDVQEKSGKSAGYTPQPGHDWNPLKRHRNFPCPCGSGQKIKRCHGRSETLPIEDIPKAKDYLRQLAAHGFIKGRRGELL